MMVHEAKYMRVSNFTTSVHLALSSIHRLLVELFTDVEVDLGGAHTGGRFDVELLSVLTDFHVRVGGRGHGHLPQHGVHSCPGQSERTQFHHFI